jgi:hypothetical protein
MMAALAHNKHVAAPPADPAEAPMSEADFRIIERASAICDHPPAVDLDQRAEQALTEAQAILRDLDAVEMADESTDEPPVIDWKSVALAAWHSEGWARAAQEYRAKRGVCQ